MSARLACGLALVLVAGCEGGPMGIADGPVEVDITRPPPERLSDMRLLEWDPDTETMLYNDRVIEYDMNTALFSDFSLKERAIYMPEGASATYVANRPLELPIGTVIVKTFSYASDMRTPDRDITVIETRLLRRTATEWEAWPYVWNEEQTDAFLEVGGESRPIDFIGADGAPRSAAYLIPQRNQCRTCHDRNVGPGDSTVTTAIGPAPRHLNRDHVYAGATVNQLTHLADLGMLDGLPALGDVPASYDFETVEAMGAGAIPTADVDRAARDYLQVNCAHCHDAQGPQGVTSQLFLNHDNLDPFRLGVCKRPGSAGVGTGGLTYDIVPGDPDNSILVFRVETVEVGAIMPLVGRSLRHDQGAALLRRWVAEMPPMACE